MIRAHGPDAVAFYISGQLMTEDYYVFNKLAKGLIGTNNARCKFQLCLVNALPATSERWEWMPRLPVMPILPEAG